MSLSDEISFNFRSLCKIKVLSFALNMILDTEDLVKSLFKATQARKIKTLNKC